MSENLPSSTESDYPAFEKVTCPQCGEDYEAIGSHWAGSSVCDFPPIEDCEMKTALRIAAGLYSVRVPDDEGAQPYIQIAGHAVEKLAVWEIELGWMARPVTYQKNEKGSRIWHLNTRSHPYLWRFVEDEVDA